MRTSLAVQPHLYIGDSTGRPLDYGMVFFGQPDKDPEFYPIDIFYDEALTIAAAQPVRTKGGFLNAVGDMVEVYAAEIEYSVKVLDAHGAAVFYEPKMSRANTDASISTKLPYPDMVLRSQADRNAERVSIKDFGAVGDGITNDSNALRNASGRTVFFPKGVYLLDGRISLQSNTKWYGEAGAVIKSTEPFAVGGFMFYSGSQNNITIDNISIDGGAANPRGGYWFDKCTNIVVKNCKLIGNTIDKTGNAGVYFKSCTKATVINCDINHFLSAIQFDTGGSEISIEGNHINNCGHICIRVIENSDYPSNIVIDGNTIRGAGHKGSLIYMGGATNAQITGRFNNVRVSNNIGIGNYESFIAGNGNADLFSLRGIRGLRCYGNRIEGGGDLGLVVEYSEEFAVSGNDVRENEISGIVIHHSKRGSVTGNICINNCADRGGQAAKNAIRAGIRIMDGSRNIAVSGNTCMDSRDLNAERTQLYGVAVIDADTGNIEIAGNQLSNNKWGNIFVETAGKANIATPISALNINSISMQHYPQATLINFRNIISGSELSAICANSRVMATTALAASGATSLALTTGQLLDQPAEGIHFLGILLNDNSVHWSKITATSGDIATLETALPSAAASGAVVKCCRFLIATKYSQPSQ